MQFTRIKCRPKKLALLFQRESLASTWRHWAPTRDFRVSWAVSVLPPSAVKIGLPPWICGKKGHQSITKMSYLHRQLILDHPCSCLCPSAARNRKWALAKRIGWEWLHQQRHASVYCQSDDSPQSFRPGRLHGGQLLSDPSSASCINWSQ